MFFFFFSSRRRHTRFDCDWSSDVCSSDLPVIEGMDQHQQTAFNMLRSPKLRQALDLSKEDPKTIKRYTKSKLDKTRYPAGNQLHFLLVRRLVEAGVPIVHFNLGYWTWHRQNFVAGRH